SMSPCVTASAEAGKATCTVLVCPGFSVTRANPTSRWGGTTTTLTGWCTYTGTTSVPATLPVLDTVNVAVALPARDTPAGPARPRPGGRTATTTTITGLPVCSRALTRLCWSGVSCGDGLAPSPSAYAFSPTATTTASADAASATAVAWSGANFTLGSSPC